MSNVSVEISGEGLKEGEESLARHWKKVLTIGAITGALTFAGTKALANNYNPGYQQEPTRAGQVMTPVSEETTYVYYELIGDTNSGFEYPEEEMDWVKNDSNVGNRGSIDLKSKCYPAEGVYPFEGEYSAKITLFAYNPGFYDGYFEINLSSEDTLKLGEFDSLLFAFTSYNLNIPTTEWDLRIDLIGEKEEVMDTITLAWGQEEENTEHRFFKKSCE